MVDCLILRTNRTLKKKRVNNKKDRFTFEKGTYYILKDKVILIKAFIGWKPCLIYKEGLSEPLGFDNILMAKTKEGNNADHVLIDANSIHNLTSKELLRVITDTTMSTTDMLLIGLVILNLLCTIGVIGVISGQ